MANEAVKTKANSSEISSTIDLDLPISPAKKEKVKKNIGEFIVESILNDLSDAKSPVTNKSFQPLSKEYKAFKKASGHGDKPNLEFLGDLTQAIDFQVTQNGVKIGVFGDEAGKADGHNNFSGKSKLPRRQFLPEEGQRFSKDINEEITKIINDQIVKDQRITKADLSTIKTQTEFWSLMSAAFPSLTRGDIRAAIARDDRLFGNIITLGLQRFLK